MTSWYRKPSNTLIFNLWNSHGPKFYKINLIKTMVNRLKSICNRNLKQLKESFLWSGYPKYYIIEKFFKITIKQKLQNLLNSVLDVP